MAYIPGSGVTIGLEDFPSPPAWPADGSRIEVETEPNGSWLPGKTYQITEHRRYWNDDLGDPDIGNDGARYDTKWAPTFLPNWDHQWDGDIVQFYGFFNSVSDAASCVSVGEISWNDGFVWGDYSNLTASNLFEVTSISSTVMDEFYDGNAPFTRSYQYVKKIWSITVPSNMPSGTYVISYFYTINQMLPSTQTRLLTILNREDIVIPIGNDTPVIGSPDHGFEDGDHVKLDDGDDVYEVSDATEDTLKLKDADGNYVSTEVGQILVPVERTFIGLDHLEGEVVQILADGAVEPEQTVVNGTVTISKYAAKVHIGLKFISKLKPMKMATQTQTGTSRGNKMRISELIVNFYRSLGCKWGQSEDKLLPVPFREVADNLGEAVPLFTGEKKDSFNGGYDTEGDILITQDQPLPLTVLSIMPSLGVSE
jgi:hypothetical protein